MQEKLYFKNSKNDKLCGILSVPHDNMSLPVVILCHGLASNKDRPTYKRLEEILNQANIATFRFDFYGCGESEGSFEDLTISEAANDIFQAINYLKNLGFRKIGLVGSSFGGAASILVAAQSKDLFFLVLRSPVSDYKGLLQETYNIGEWKNKGYRERMERDGRRSKLNYSFFKDASRLDGFELAKQIKVPAFIVHGSADEIVPVEQSQKTVTLIPNCKLELIEGADHRYTNPIHFAKGLKLISDFIISQSGFPPSRE